MTLATRPRRAVGLAAVTALACTVVITAPSGPALANGQTILRETEVGSSFINDGNDIDAQAI
jgi:hypothetical protein